MSLLLALLEAPPVDPGGQLNPEGIASQEAFGTPTLSLSILPVSIVSLEAVGAPAVVTTGLLTVPSIASLEAVGAPVVVRGGVTLLPGSVTSLESVSSPLLQPGAITLSPVSIVSLQAFSAPLVSPQAVLVLPESILSTEAFALPEVRSVVRLLAVGSIPTAEAFASPSLSLFVLPSSVGSQEAFGLTKLGYNLGDVGGIVSSELVETPQVRRLLSEIFVYAIFSEENVPSPIVLLPPREGIRVRVGAVGPSTVAAAPRGGRLSGTPRFSGTRPTVTRKPALPTGGGRGGRGPGKR